MIAAVGHLSRMGKGSFWSSNELTSGKENCKWTDNVRSNLHTLWVEGNWMVDMTYRIK